MPSNNLASTEVSPLRHVRDITTFHKGKDNTTYDTFCALPSPPRPYCAYDYAVIAEIIKHADTAVARAYRKGTGSGLVTLQSILQAYEHILPRHGIKPDEDTYYYRLILKLSLDPEPDWWVKLNRETGTTGGAVSSNRSTPRAGDSRPSSVYRVSPTRLPRSIGTGNNAKPSVHSASATPSVRSRIPTIGGGRIPGRASPYRTSKSLARSTDLELQDAIRTAVAQTARLRASWEASQDTASRSAHTSPRNPSSQRASPRKGSQEAGRNIDQDAETWATREAAARALVIRHAIEATQVPQHAAWDGTQIGADDRSVRSIAGRSAVSLQAAARQAAARLDGSGPGMGEFNEAARALQEAAEQATAAAYAAVDAARGVTQGHAPLPLGRYEMDTPSATLTEGSLRALSAAPRSAPASAASGSVDGRSMMLHSVTSEGGAPSSFYRDDFGDTSDYGAASSRYASYWSQGTRDPSGVIEHSRSYRDDGVGMSHLGSRVPSSQFLHRSLSNNTGGSAGLSFGVSQFMSEPGTDSLSADRGSGGGASGVGASVSSARTGLSGSSFPTGTGSGIVRLGGVARSENGASGMHPTASSTHGSVISASTRGGGVVYGSSMRSDGGLSTHTHTSGRMSSADPGIDPRGSGGHFSGHASEYGGSTNRGGSVRSASANGATSVPASAGAGAGGSSAYSSSAPGDVGAGSVRASSQNLGRSASSGRSVGGLSSNTGFGGFRSDMGENKGRGGGAGDPGLAAANSDSEASFRPSNGTVRDDGGPGPDAIARSHAASLRTGSSISPVPRGSGSFASGTQHDRSYSAWPDCPDGIGGGGDGFSFHSSAVASGVSSGVFNEIRRPGVASAGGFGHVSAGGAESLVGDAGGCYGYPPGASGIFGGRPDESSFSFATGGGGPVPYGQFPPDGSIAGGFHWPAPEAAAGGGGGLFPAAPGSGPWGPNDDGRGNASGSGGGGAPLGRPPSPPDDEDDEDDESDLPEDAEAYMDFSRMARAFQTWRRNTCTRMITRSERDQALHNWAVAASFWAVQLLRRCFTKWHSLAPRKALMAMSIWGDNSRAGCFRRWLVFTRFLRSKNAQGVRLWRVRLLKRSWRQWRHYTWSRQRKVMAAKKARLFRTDRMLHSSWLSWQTFTAYRVHKCSSVRCPFEQALMVKKAVGFWSDLRIRAYWLEWRYFTVTKRRVTLGTRKALEFWSRHAASLAGRQVLDRLYTPQLLAAMARVYRQAEAQGSGFGACVEFLGYAHSICLSALVATTYGCSAAQGDSRFLADDTSKALRLWTGRTLAACLSTWQDFTAKQKRKALGLAKAEGLWRIHTFRNCLSEWSLLVQEARRSWQLSEQVYMRRLLHNWHLVACSLAKLSAAYNTIQQAACNYALKILRPLLRDVFYCWLDWHEGRMLRRSRETEARHSMNARKQRLVMRAWYGNVVASRKLKAACQSIMRNEVKRVMVSALRQLRREHDNARRAAEGRRAVERGAARRCLRHWKALGQARQAQDEWRAQRLQLVTAQRTRRVMTAWQLVACLHAEHERLVHICTVRIHRRRAATIIQAWRGRVLGSVTKRMKMLAALLAWERGLKTRAWRAWSNLLAASRASASRFAMAARHHRTRRLGLCFGVLLKLWRAYRERLGRALRFRDVHALGLLAEVLAAWRELVEVLKWKNIRMRRAETHGRHRLLAGSLYGWYYVARHRLASKHAVAVAVLHWVRRRRAAALAWWRAWAATHRAMRLRGEGYARVRATRTKAWVLVRLRANVIQNARIAGAIAHRNRYMARLALSGWLLRTLLAGEWVSRLWVIAEQLSWQLLADSLAAWQEFILHRRRKHGMIRTAMHYWRLGRQRNAWDSLRWHATNRQIMRAAMARGRQGAASRVLRAWREEAHYRRGLRDRFALIQARSRRMALRHGMDRWRIFLALRVFRREQHFVSGQHYLRSTAWRAFRSWYNYHMHLRHAFERAQAITHRWRRRDAAEVLTAFAENVVFQRQMRDAAEVFRITCSRRVLAAWQEFLGIKRATDFWSHKRLIDVFGAWGQYVLWRRGLRAIGAQVALRWRSLTAALVLATWRDLTRERLRLMELGFMLAARTTRTAVSALLYSWQAYAVRSARRKRTGALVMARKRAATLHACLNGWHTAATRRASLKRAAATTIANSQRSTLLAVFGFWYWHAANAARLRLISEQLAARTRRCLLAAAMAAWCSHVGRAVRLRALQETIAASARFAAARATFEAWHERAAYKAHLRFAECHVSAQLQLKVSGAVFDEWHARAAYKARLCRAERALACRIRLATLGNIFSSWLGYSNYKVQCKRSVRVMRCRRQRRTQLAVLQGWRIWAAYMAHLAAAEARMARRHRVRLLAEACCAWRAYTEYKGQLRKAEERVRERWQRRLLAEACMEWHLCAWRIGGLKALLERVLVRLTALAFYGWRELVAEGKHWRAVQSAMRAMIAQKPALGETACYAIVRLRMWPLSLVFYTWYDNAQECRYLRDKTTDAVFTYAGSLLRKALATWLAYALRRHHMRQKIHRFVSSVSAKMLRKTLREWHRLAMYLGRLRLAAMVLKQRVDDQMLRFTLGLWRETAARWAGLKTILARNMARLLSLAWEVWLEETVAGRKKARAVSFIGARWARRDLAALFAAWHRLVTALNAARRILARAQRRHKEWAWAVWQEVVFQMALERGNELHQRRIAVRALQGWHDVVVDARREAVLKAQMQRRVVEEAFMELRRQWLAQTYYRRLYYRRTLGGWYKRAQELRQERARLWHASRAILYGCLARCFTVWWQHTQAMTIKRAVFVRKQRALAEALRRGDELVARRNAELAELTFRAWRMLASRYKEVHRRRAVLGARLVAGVWADWRETTLTRRATKAKMAAVLRRRLLARPFTAWRKAAAAAASKLDIADSHRRAVLLDAALSAWLVHHNDVASRRMALRRALAAGWAAAAAALRARAWEAWCEAMLRRMAVRQVVEQAFQRRCRRRLGQAFDVWLKYTQAMRTGGIDPGSPYLTPRDRDVDRRLVTRMAALAGNDQALAGPEIASSAGVLDGLYPSSALKHALERRQEVSAFLSLARNTLSAGGARRTPGSAFASAMLAERQRQGDRRASHGSGSGSGSTAGSSHGSSLVSAPSSGANGADLSELALQVVRATPGLSPAGKTRAPTAPRPRPTKPLSSDLGISGSLYDDRLDLRALYDNVGMRASYPPPPAAAATAGLPPPGPFGGFTPVRPLGDSPMPLPRGVVMPSNPASAAHIAPRRIDFTGSRGDVGTSVIPLPAAYDNSQYYYGYGTPSRSQQARVGADSDISSVTSGELLPLDEVQARAIAPAAAEKPPAVAAVPFWISGTTPGARHASAKGRNWAWGSSPQATGFALKW
ncbi:hypothetical protein VOLCADRAFT_87353 [Volvox carteri f. nagariensis]|uniref:Sfi1 spindle body domain-containing protein n=1 Tax=Volvox carteri f. nagariensis TaxID=3068 RepID=D8TL47_VOLCA|nr:uncharacterized protein VOLCADRAFT_87353 [Volvox carteri f. nagariensis]EFJ51807.1 hypothetical protein VOLCADRAFT_87353 [Volvox carteri f. nagariensis]|eukprot:XP_002947217.1 hypothetical protein VOLCADRAFT_87353 [Volvox carteri f. nagariensis]